MLPWAVIIEDIRPKRVLIANLAKSRLHITYGLVAKSFEISLKER